MAQRRWIVISAVVAFLSILVGISQSPVAKEQIFLNVMGGSNESSSHQDDSRSTVGWTAFLIALFRALESDCDNNVSQNSSSQVVRLCDPVAEKMFSLWDGSAPISARILRVLAPWLEKIIPMAQRLRPVVALRTFFLDEQIEQALARSLTTKQQFVIVGAGLDSRVFRLSSLLDRTTTPLIHTFELDFPGMLVEKQRLFSAVGFDYSNKVSTTVVVGTDLTMSGWEKLLLEKGFDPSLPTLWLMEGFLSYLKQDEMDNLFEVVTKLSPPSSRILATWLAAETEFKSMMHQTFVDNPTALLSRFGFSKEIQVQELQDVAAQVGRFQDAPYHAMLLTSHEKVG